MSFQTRESKAPDCFIEVKAISDDYGFFWSQNEYEIAKLKGESYFLYLVRLSKIQEACYAPTIIQNPAKIIMNSEEWYIEPQSYSIRRLFEAE